MDTNIKCKAAFSQIDITPDFQVELIGCYRPDAKSQGVLHPLSAQALVFEYCGRRFCLIAIDSLGLTTALSDKVRLIAAKQLKEDPAHVMLCFSHTHSAPAPLSPVNGERYFRLLCSRVKECVKDAFSKLRDCQAGWDVTETGIGENRREGCTVVDKRLGALKIADYQGKPIAVVLRVTAHANVLMRENNKISSDYFFTARQRLQTLFNCPVMLIQGAAGNVKPCGVDKINGGTLADVDRITETLFDSAKRLRFNMKELTRLSMYERDIQYISDVPSKEQAQKIAQKAKANCGIDGTNWLLACEKLRKSGVRTQSCKGKVCFLYLNDGCLCGVPEEIFCEISLKASERVKNPFFFLNGYTNGCGGYLAHSAEWIKGGYELLDSYLEYYPFHGHVMPFQKDTAYNIAALVFSEWEKHLGY